MEMTQSGKVTPLVELMASVFFGCKYDLCSMPPGSAEQSSVFAVVGREFIPCFDRIAKLRIFPPITATADAHQAFIGYGASILDGMLQKGEINNNDEKTAEKTNVSKLLCKCSGFFHADGHFSS